MFSSDGKPLISLQDFRRRAKEVLSPEGWAFYDDAAGRKSTYLDSSAAFDRYVIRPRILRDVTKRTLVTSVLGQLVSMPICVAPTSMHRYAHPDAEKATAKGAASVGTLMVLSSACNTLIADVGRASPDGLRWMQLCLTKNKKHAEHIISQAVQAKFKAIVLTVDLPIQPKYPFHQRFANGRYYTDPDFRCFVNYNDDTIPEVQMAKQSGDVNLSHYISDQISSSPLTWEDVRWLTSITSLPIVLKGILTAEAAREAADAGVAGIIVSAHGGRPLDGVPAPIDVLCEVVAAVKDRNIEVYMDGGVRSGSDVLKAIGMGARAVFIGRPVLWGLACGGAAGVEKVLSILRDEFEEALALSGCTSPTDLLPSLIARKSSY